MPVLPVSTACIPASTAINTMVPSALHIRILDNMNNLISSPEIIDLLSPSPGGTIDTRRGKFLTCLNTLRDKGFWSQQQDDASNRCTAVGMQVIIENALLSFLQENKANKLALVVHTHNPPTPLCTQTPASIPDMMPQRYPVIWHVNRQC